MKRTIAAFLSATLLLSTFAGCSGAATTSSAATAASGAASTAATDGAASTAQVKSGVLNAGVTIYKFDDTFMSGARNAISAAAQGGNVKVDIVDSQGDSSIQSNKVDTFIAKNVNALAVNPPSPTDAPAIIDKVKAKNIPIVFFNNKLEDKDMQKWDQVYYVGAKAEESGIMQGDIMAKYWKAHPEADKNKDGKMDYVMITGLLGTYDVNMRTKYSIDEVTKAGIQTNCIASATAGWDRAKAQDQMASIISSKGDKIEAVFSNNDDMALGAIEALKAAGYFKGGKYIPVVGVDATAAGCKAIKDGTLLGSAFNNPKALGEATYKVLSVIANGNKPTKDNTGFDVTDGRYIWLGYKAITKDNVADAQQ